MPQNTATTFAATQGVIRARVPRAARIPPRIRHHVAILETLGDSVSIKPLL
jgi:hypothetical protein